MHLLKKFVLPTLLLMFSLSATATAQEFEPRAQAVIAGLTRLNGLSGWPVESPAAWPQSASVDANVRQASIRRQAAVTWSPNTQPLVLIGLNLENMGLSRAADLSGLTFLGRLELSGNVLTALNLDGDTALLHLSALNNQLKTLRLGSAPELRHLALSGNQLERLDLSANPRLESLGLSMNRLTSLDISRQPSLHTLEAANNQLSGLNLAANPALTRLQLSYNRLTALDLSRQRRLTELELRDNALESLSLSASPALVELATGRNRLRQLDLSRNPALVRLSAEHNQLAALDLSRNPNLETVEAQGNPLRELRLGDNTLPRLASLNLDGCSLPLSRLAPLVGRGRERTRFGRQEGVLFDHRVLPLNEALDLSAEAMIGGVATEFTVLSAKKRRLRPSEFQVTGGIIRFKQPGIYYIEMTNDNVYSSETSGSAKRQRQFKTRVRSGAVEVVPPSL